jgi:hypothetical protein
MSRSTVFKKSHQSYFIQFADAVAFSLLKREVVPTPHVKRYEIDRMFEKMPSGRLLSPGIAVRSARDRPKIKGPPGGGQAGSVCCR